MAVGMILPKTHKSALNRPQFLLIHRNKFKPLCHSDCGKKRVNPRSQHSGSQLTTHYSQLQRSCTPCLFLAYPQGDAVAILGFFPSGSE